MAEQDLLNAFSDCVDRIASGQTIDECLNHYPQFAGDLRPMLEAGLLIRRMRIPATEVLEAQTRVRYRFEDAVRSEPGYKSRPSPGFVRLIAAILLIGFVTTAVAGTVGQSSIPGDMFYSLKRLTEQVQGAIISSDFNQRRIEEIQQLLALRRPIDVSFIGTVTSIERQIWTIAQLPITIDSQTAIDSVIKIGDKVEVQANTTTSGELIAQQIKLLQPSSEQIATTQPTSLPSFTPLPPTSTSAPSPTATPLPIATAITTILPSPLSPTTCVVTQPEGWVTYSIQPGDTVSSLALRSGIFSASLMAVNCISDANHIVVGQLLYLPNPVLPPSTSTVPDNGNSGSGSGNSGSGSNNTGSDDNGDHGGGGDGSDDNSGHG